MQHFRNNPDYSNTDKTLNPELFSKAYENIITWPDYEPTTLTPLPSLAKDLGLGQIYFKDESTRFGLKSFKALGGSYAVLFLLKEHLTTKYSHDKITDTDIKSGKYAEDIKKFTVITATDGNHGRSVAWGAKQCGIKCHVYMHKGVSQSRGLAVELLGATVTWVDGNYDDSLHKVNQKAIENGWHIISDTSYDGYTYVPKIVMAGYTVMTKEIESQLKDHVFPTHFIVQGGVGGLAGALCSHAKLMWGDKCPRFIIVEPQTADCLYQSALAGEPKTVNITTETLMGGLSCGEVSLIGWNILKDNADDFTTISDEYVKPAMCTMAMGKGNDPAIEAGESGVTGVALLMELKNNPEIKAALGLDENSRVLLIGTEGATDPEMYNEIISGG